MTITNLVAIAGGTCAGKTQLSEGLIAAIPAEGAVLSQDSFYPDRSTWDYREIVKFNWDDLKSFNINRIESCLCELILNQSISVPRYNRMTHAIEGDRTLIIGPVKVLIFEGLHAIALARHCLQQVGTDAISLTTIFIDCEEGERRRRRMQRERLAKTVPGDFVQFWEERCEPTFHAQVLPQRGLADVIIKSPWPSGTLADLARAM